VASTVLQTPRIKQKIERVFGSLLFFFIKQQLVQTFWVELFASLLLSNRFEHTRKNVFARPSMSLCSWPFETALTNTFPTKCRWCRRQSCNPLAVVQWKIRIKKNWCWSKWVDGLLEALCICRGSRRNSGELRLGNLPRINSST
jgi:hypothetical protein